MKRFIVAALAIVLLAGCKSQVTRELDEVEQRIAAISVEEFKDGDTERDLNGIAEEIKGLWDVSKDLFEIHDKQDGELSEKEEAQYLKLKSWIVAKDDTLRQEARRVYARKYQKDMREDGHLEFTTQLLGDEEDILMLTDSDFPKAVAVEVGNNEGLRSFWRTLKFRKIIFANRFGPIHSVENP